MYVQKKIVYIGFSTVYGFSHPLGILQLRGDCYTSPLQFQWPHPLITYNLIALGSFHPPSPAAPDLIKTARPSTSALSKSTSSLLTVLSQPSLEPYSSNFINIILNSLALFTFPCFHLKTPTRMTTSIPGSQWDSHWTPNRENCTAGYVGTASKHMPPNPTRPSMLSSILCLPTNSVLPPLQDSASPFPSNRNHRPLVEYVYLFTSILLVSKKDVTLSCSKESLNLFLKPTPSCQFRDFIPSGFLFFPLFSNSASLWLLRTMLKSVSSLRNNRKTPLSFHPVFPFGYHSFSLPTWSEQSNSLCQHFSLLPSCLSTRQSIAIIPLTPSSLTWPEKDPRDLLITKSKGHFSFLILHNPPATSHTVNYSFLPKTEFSDTRISWFLSDYFPSFYAGPSS